jgi:hypothetical protein
MRAVIFGYFGTLTDPGAEEYREPRAHRTGELLGGCRPRLWEALAGSFGERTIGVHGGTESTLTAVALSCGANPSSAQLPVALAHHRSGHARLRKPRHHALGVLAELRRRGSVLRPWPAPDPTTEAPAPVSNTLARADSFAGTSTTISPSATRRWAMCLPMPLQPSTAQIRSLCCRPSLSIIR